MVSDVEEPPASYQEERTDATGNRLAAHRRAPTRPAVCAAAPRRRSARRLPTEGERGVPARPPRQPHKRYSLCKQRPARAPPVLFPILVTPAVY